MTQMSARITRNEQAGRLSEAFLVAAVSTVLIVRWLLDLTGYPRLGGGGLHVAHLLYGGLLMLVAVLALLTLLDRRVQYGASVVAGVGFGLFIDELGKFITSDNDYFFRPAIAIIYSVFVALYFVLRAVGRQAFSRRESLANAMDLLIDGLDGTIDGHTHRRVATLLDDADPAHPLVRPLREYNKTLVERGWLLDTVARAEEPATRLYDRAVSSPWFQRVVILVMALYALGELASDAVVLASGGSAAWTTVSDVGQTVSTVVGAAFVAIGVLELPRSRLHAYRWFLRGVLIWLLVTQVFVFYQSQLAGVGGLAADLTAYAVLRFILAREPGPPARTTTA